MFENKVSRQHTMPIRSEASTFFAPAIQRNMATTASTAKECTPSNGIPPTNCSAYSANSDWLPDAYVNNATCACSATPDSPTSNCVRKSLQDKLAATPDTLKNEARLAKRASLLTGDMLYNAYVQSRLTPRIYDDHVNAYKDCCCPCGPAPYWAWIGVTTVPMPSCDLVGAAINQFGSCHCTPGAW